MGNLRFWYYSDILVVIGELDVLDAVCCTSHSQGVGQFEVLVLVVQSDILVVESRLYLNILVGDEFLHPLDLALVFGQRFVVQAALQQVFFAVVDLSTMLQLEGTQSS